MSEDARPPASGLIKWCRAIEDRLAGAQAEKIELTIENERLQKRLAELTAVLKGIEEAYLLGKLRAAGLMPQLIPPAGSRGAVPPPPSSPPAPAPPRKAQPKTEVLEAPVPPPEAEAAGAIGEDPPEPAPSP